MKPDKILIELEQAFSDAMMWNGMKRRATAADFVRDIRAEASKTQWIPTSERLPGNDELCAVGNLETGPHAYSFGAPSSWENTLELGFYSNTGKWYANEPGEDDSFLMDSPPTHWHELPEPPE